MKSFLAAAALSAALIATTPAALADDGSGADARFAATTLDLSGHGEARVAPDMATIRLGVTAQAPDAAQAMAQSAAAMTRVVSALRAAGIEAGDIQTVGLDLAPQYVYAQGQPPKLTGYQATNDVTVRVEDLARLGAVVDAGTDAGAANLGQISFGLKSRAAAETQARLAAVKALDDKAQTLAEAAGYRVKRLVNLAEAASETVPSPRPPVLMAAARAATPVEAGELTVSVDVSGEFELER